MHYWGRPSGAFLLFDMAPSDMLKKAQKESAMLAADARP
jgi:hypothetical protein